MTINDWLGVFFTVGTFIVMVIIYVVVLRPSNKDKYEAQRGMALDDDDMHANVGDKK